jgi:hypothetical protein
VDGGGEAVRDSSDEVRDSLGLDDLEDAKRQRRRDGREGSLKVVPRGWGYSVGSAV